MVLIEGLGDEVTLVLGSFILIVILFFAWLSTHTEEIPLIFEGGVLVLTRQRRQNRQPDQPLVTDQPADNEISVQVREGIIISVNDNNLSSNETSLSSSVGSEDDSRGNNSQQSDLEDRTEGREGFTTPDNLDSTNTAAVNASGIVKQEKPKSEVRDTNVKNDDRENLCAQGGESSHIPSSDSHQESSSDIILPSLSQDHHLDGEVLRRRRVQYYEAGESSGNNIIKDEQNFARRFNDSVSPGCDSSLRLRDIIDKDDSDTRIDRISNSGVPCSVSGPSSQSVGRKDQDRHVGGNGDGANHKIVSELSDRLERELKIDNSDNSTETDIADIAFDYGTATEVVENNVNDNGETGNGSADAVTAETRLSSENVDTETSIRVRLKYMNETQRFVQARREDTVGDFRRAHFQPELQDNKWVRFIFNGQDLRDDNSTLRSYNIENNCTMHCLVTSRQQSQPRQEVHTEDEDDTVLGRMMYPLFTVLLLVVWYFRIFYRQYFSAMSTVCLIGISFLLGLSYVSSLRAADNSPPPVVIHRSVRIQGIQLTGEGRTTDANHPHAD